MTLAAAIYSLLFLFFVSEPGEQVSIESASLKRRDLPNDFPFQTLDAGFAILSIRIENQSDNLFSFKVEDIAAFGPKNKKLERALPTEITPKILKYYSKGIPDVHGGVSYGYPGYPRGPGVVRTSPSGPSGGPGTIDAGTGPRLRSKLEQYEVKSITLQAGESTEGFFYVKSKKSGNFLSGGYVLIEGKKASF